MSNMSYCRFQNTVRDLADCQNALEEFFQGGEEISSDEMPYAHELVQTCRNILQLVADQRSIEVDPDDALNNAAITDIFDCAAALRDEDDSDDMLDADELP